MTSRPVRKFSAPQPAHSSHPRLHRQGIAASKGSSTALSDGCQDLSRWRNQIEELRDRLAITANDLDDADIAESLNRIAARTEARARWLSAFNSPLGRWLAVRGSDLNTELNIILSALPPACA